MAERTGNGGHGLVKGATVFGLAVPMIVIVPLVMLMSLSTILVAMVQSQYGTNCGLSNAAGTTTSWVEWAKNIAADDSHGYSQPRRTGNPDYDCSSLVYYALKQAGLDVGSYPFSTYGEDAALKHAGFERHDWSRVSDLQTGDEISIDSYAAGYAAYYRYKGSMNVNDPHGGQSSAQAVSGSTGSTNVVGMSEKDAEAWFNGQQGPNNLCVAYAYGQCTWWTCMRAKKLGWKNIGQYWGNGQDWARSATAAGYKTTTDAPVAGSIISWPAGVQDSDPTYGHVGIVESVDTAKGTITTSEKGAGYKVYSRTMPIRNGGTYVLPNDKLTGMGASGSSGTEQCVTGDDSTSDVSGDKASAADAKKMARRKLKDFGWDDSQFDCLDKLWTRESGWQWNATNPSSGAYGIPQSLPGGKMASAGQDWKTNAATQVKWGLGYIQQRYQSPCGAWAHSEATGWY